MSRLTSKLACAAAASLMVFPAPLAAADPLPAGTIVMPLLSKFRACDFTVLDTVGSAGTAQVIAHVTSTSGSVVATVDMAAAVPNTSYEVRLIQLPRPSIGCAPGAPGVAAGRVQTNAVGSGNTTLEGAVQSGATDVWVFVERFGQFSQKPVEFYSPAFVAAI